MYTQAFNKTNYNLEYLYIMHFYPNKRIEIMTALGEFLARRSVNKSMVARRTGLSKARMNELSLNTSAKLRADELYLIAKAIDADPCELLTKLYGHLELLPDEQ